MYQAIFCEKSLVFDMNVTIVCVDKLGKAVRVPEELRNKFKAFIEDSNNHKGKEN